MITTQIRRSMAAEDSVRRSTFASAARRVWVVQGVSEKKHTVRGAVIGGIAGLLFGGAAGGFIGGGFCDAADCSGDTREGILVGGAIGAGVGVAVGALIGYVW